jgi:hypothetical protein
MLHLNIFSNYGSYKVKNMLILYVTEVKAYISSLNSAVVWVRDILVYYAVIQFYFTFDIWFTFCLAFERRLVFFVFFTRVETGSNTSTLTLRVVGGNEKVSLESETVKYGRESQGTQTRERLRWQVSAAYTKDTPVLSPERAPLKNQTVTAKQ